MEDKKTTPKWGRRYFAGDFEMDARGGYPQRILPRLRVEEMRAFGATVEPIPLTGEFEDALG